MNKAILLLLLGLAGLIPLTAEAEVVITHPLSYETSKGLSVGVALFDMASDQADHLVAANAPDICGHVELHSMKEEDGLMKMRRVENIPLSAKAPLSLGPSGYHLMLMDLKSPLQSGKTYPLTLIFSKAGEKTITVTVQPRIHRE